MRRFAALIAVVALCLAAGGCGGGHHKPVSPLDDAVGYFSKDAPFVAAVETDPDGPQVKQVRELVGRFPGSEILAARLQNVVRLRFVDWSRDIRPQLGAPLVVGLAKPAAGSKAIAIATVVAMRIKHPLRVKQVLLRQPNFRGRGKTSGVRIYENVIEHRFAAVDGHMLVAATDRDILAHALALKRTDNRMRASGFAHDLSGLPAGGLIRVSADPRQLIGADPRLRPALTVKWLASLRRLGAVVKFGPTGATLDLHGATDGASIGDADLPLAPSGAPPPLIGSRDEVQLGIREPGRLARLLAAVWRAVAPRRAAALRALEPRGIDLEKQIPRHLADRAVLAYNPVSREFAARATLNDAADVKSALAQLAPALPAVAAMLGVKGVGIATPEAGESFYALAKLNGRTAVFGVVGDTIVAASEAPRAAGLASEPTHVAPVKGSAVITLNARQVVGSLLAQRLRGIAGVFAPLAVASLRDFSGALTIRRSGVSGHFRLTIVK